MKRACRIRRRSQRAGTRDSRCPDLTQEKTAMAKDPVCGMSVDEKKAAASSVYKGTTYYFCAPGCKTTFEKTPEKFIGKGGTHTGH